MKNGNKIILSITTFPKLKFGLALIFAVVLGGEFILSSLIITKEEFKAEFSEPDNVTMLLFVVVVLGLAFLDYLHYTKQKDFELKKLELMRSNKVSPIAKAILEEAMGEN
jgi:hypothetical protein